MKMLTLLLAFIVVMADAHLTYKLLTDGHDHNEGTRMRRWFIRAFGLRLGTYGVGLAFCAICAAVNVYSRQPEWGLVVGNLGVVALFGYAVYRNDRVR